MGAREKREAEPLSRLNVESFASKSVCDGKETRHIPGEVAGFCAATTPAPSAAMEQPSTEIAPRSVIVTQRRFFFCCLQVSFLASRGSFICICYLDFPLSWLYDFCDFLV